MAAYEIRTFSDIYTRVREELKLQASDTTNIQRIKRLVNEIYLDEVCPYEQWDWLHGRITLVAAEIPAFAARVLADRW